MPGTLTQFSPGYGTQHTYWHETHSTIPVKGTKGMKDKKGTTTGITWQPTLENGGKPNHTGGIRRGCSAPQHHPNCNQERIVDALTIMPCDHPRALSSAILHHFTHFPHRAP
jgi:hypothetical protein